MRAKSNSTNALEHRQSHPLLEFLHLREMFDGADARFNEWTNFAKYQSDTSLHWPMGNDSALALNAFSSTHKFVKRFSDRIYRLLPNVPSPIHVHFI